MARQLKFMVQWHGGGEKRRGAGDGVARARLRVSDSREMVAASG
jgi:hypothetical protein